MCYRNLGPGCAFPAPPSSIGSGSYSRRYLRKLYITESWRLYQQQAQSHTRLRTHLFFFISFLYIPFHTSCATGDGKASYSVRTSSEAYSPSEYATTTSAATTMSTSYVVHPTTDEFCSLTFSLTARRAGSAPRSLCRKARLTPP